MSNVDRPSIINLPMVGVGISLSPSTSKFRTIFDINFSIVSDSIGLFLVAILIDLEILSRSKGSRFPLPLITVYS